MADEHPTVRAFTKPDCVFCTRAKRALSAEGVHPTEYDVHADVRNADASAYFSGSYTLPQVFIGDRHIGSADDVERLHNTGRLAELLASAAPELPVDRTPAEELARGARDLPLLDAIGTRDGTHDADPETWPILHLYRRFFGFWPNTFAHLSLWPEAYKLFVYCQNAAAVQAGSQCLGTSTMSAVSFTTSSAHGCSYCMTHAVSVSASGPQTTGVLELLRAARRGTAEPDNPFGPHELALADLAARATRNAVTDEVIERVRATASQARQGDCDPEARLAAATLVVASFGFLNVFNDLTGARIEGDWAASAAAQGVAAGRHAVEAHNPDNLRHNLPEGGPTLHQMMARYDSKVSDLDDHLRRELGFVPAWIRSWPAMEQRRHAYLYTELMGDRPSSLITAELKHLMARVSAIARGHDYLASAEALMAWHTAADKDRAITRIERCFATASATLDDQGIGDGVFDERERAALRLAWLSAQVPLVTPQRFVQPAIDLFSSDELLHLVVVCSVAGMIQRAAAIIRPRTEPEVWKFVDGYRLETDPLALRYPLPTA